MALYEMRTYTLYVGKMAEATKLYQELGFPALKKGGHDNKLIGYFQGDTGTINQLVRNPDFRCSLPSTCNRVAGITQRRKAPWEKGPCPP
jgi:hypothetical protein